VPVALAQETVTSFALLGLSIAILLGGILVGRWLGTAANSTIRVAFPLIAIGTLSLYALLVYVARITR
jgi:uncharacterized membrane protein (Fun14 family)